MTVSFSDWKISSRVVTAASRLMLFLGALATTIQARRQMRDDQTKGQGALQLTLAAATTILAGYWMTTPTAKPSKGKTLLPVNKDKSLIWREDGGLSKLVSLHPNNIARNKELKTFTMEDVAQRNSKNEAWIIIDDLVYDVTNFVSKHPGGELVLLDMAGKDCTDVFANYHSARIYKSWLPPYLIGKVESVHVPPHVKDFRNVRQELLRRGLFETSKSYYAELYVWYFFLLASSLYLSLAGESTAAHMTGALLMGFFWQQLAGLGHDLGHGSVSHDVKHDSWVGATIISGLLGISTSWWKKSHNTHHVVCNSIEHDPDIQHMPFFAVSEKILEKPFWSTYHSKVVHFDAVARILIRYQHLLFFPIMMFGRINLYVQSWLLVFTTPRKDSVVFLFRNTEVLSLLFFFGWYSCVALSMPTWGETIAYTAISHAFTALLHIQICLSHFSMETYHGNAYNDDSDEWYKMQIKTTLNVDCPEWFDFFHIGLQFQVEHHLFPSLPRHNLREARKLVKEVCRKHGITYHELTFLEGVKKTYMGLQETAMKARSGAYDVQRDTHKLMDMLNARG